MGVFFFIVTVIFACSRGDDRPSARVSVALAAPGSSSDPSSLPSVLPTRAEVVARADALAVRGSQDPGPAGASLLSEAASLRQQIFRLEGVPADALEAIELLRRASTRQWPGACDAAIDLALLEGETKADPSGAYRAVYAARARYPRDRCGERATTVLRSLSAFEPPRDVLTAIDGEAHGENPPQGHAASPAVAVIQPTIARATHDEPAKITAVERYGGKDAARVVVVMTRPARYSAAELPPDPGHGPRLFVDVSDTRYDGKASYPGAGIVDRVRVAEKGGTTRVVLDLGAAASHRIFYLPEPFRLVIDVSNEAPPDPATGPRRVRRVVLDPGHGGNDPGAQGPGGLREKDVVLDVAHRAAPLIARELGISTLLTRDADTYVPLDERVAKANAFSSDLFVSIHCNAAESPSGHGVMTFVLDSSRDDTAIRVAARENSASTEAATELAAVMSRTTDSVSLSRSARLAELLQRAALSSLLPRYPDVVDHGVKSAGFYVLAGARMPAVLFESSFISNPVEERRLDTADYRQKLADAVVNAVRAFRDGV